MLPAVELSEPFSAEAIGLDWSICSTAGERKSSWVILWTVSGQVVITAVDFSCVVWCGIFTLDFWHCTISGVDLAS